MALNDESHIRELVRQLDEAVPREGRVNETGDPQDDGMLVRADQAGYLRLGVELSKAAFAPLNGSEAFPRRVDVDFSGLVGLERHTYSFERSDDLEADEGESARIAPGWSVHDHRMAGQAPVLARRP
jgi:hypothetical protein